MITVSQLINQTYTQLNPEDKPEMLSRETVRTIIEEIGIADLMKAQEPEHITPRLLVQRIAIQGRKRLSKDHESSVFDYRRTFGSGLNAWIANNSTGKSTILKTIQWALTGECPNFKPDVSTWLEDIALEVKITGDDTYTIRCLPSSVSGGVYNLPLESVLSGDGGISPVVSFSNQREMTRNIAQFFGEKMGFSPLQWGDWTRHSMDVTDKLISWDTYAQAMFLIDEDYKDYFLPPLVTGDKFRHRQKALGMYLGIDLLEALSRIELNRQHAERDYKWEQAQVKANSADVQTQIEELQAELEGIETQIQRIDAEQSPLVDTTYVQQVNAQVAQWTTQIIGLGEQQRELEAEEQQAQTELNNARRAVQALQEAIEFKVFLSGLEVEKCPHCENQITRIPIEQEIESGHCHVCNGELRPVSSVDNQQGMLDQIRKSTKNLEKDVRRIRKQKKNVTEVLVQAQQEVNKYDAELHDLARRQREGFTTEMRTLLARQGYLKGQLTELSKQTKESRAPQIRAAKDRYDILRVAFTQLQKASAEQNQAVLEFIGTQVTQTARAFGVRNLEGVYLNQQFRMSIRQSGKTTIFEKMDTGEALRLKIAFHLALLDLQISQGTGRHPAFLVIDAPGSAEIDQQHFGSILDGLAALQDRLGDQVQILIASTRDKLADICKPEQLQQLPMDETLF